MKKIALLIFFFLGLGKFLACECILPQIGNEYIDADVVAYITIVKTYGDSDVKVNELPHRIYKADITTDRLIKGTTPNTLTVLGSVKSIFGGACEKMLKPGEKYLVILKKGQDEDYIISACSSIFLIEKQSQSQYYDSLFKFLDENKDRMQNLNFIQFKDKSLAFNNKKKSYESDFLKLPIENMFGIYKVTGDNNGNIKHIETISGIANYDDRIKKLLFKNFYAPYFANKKALILFDYTPYFTNP